MRHRLPDGLELYYELYGDTDAKQTLVFLNGLSQSTAVWAGMVYYLGKRYKLVLVDLLFQGKAGAASEFRSFEEHAADLAHLLQELRLSETTVVGISFGGAVVQRLMVNNPELVQKAVLLSTFPYKDAYLEAIINSWEKALLTGGYPLMLEVMLPFVFSRNYFSKPVISIENLKKSKGAPNLTTDSLLKLIETMKASGNYLQELKTIQVPVLLVHGAEDIVCPPELGEAMSTSLPNAQLKVLPRVGHTLNLECMPVLIQLLDEFVQK
ncbi:alpha/beta fold hydrolase [Pontibacter silvestris]|uniref:Alpha/beta fold hydrolase n=1 Tax=Pontibacter silvestris TaxID=2305183 RepID=A0ABW4X2Q2_9BACT|nr:alpha/beta hydrolase [Pontibacter silvestris]MCC9135777.1 alpha/beta hydrolase [Pontibacter silvestris]